jgi:GNAT superfamily N-acetyltransferase
VTEISVAKMADAAGLLALRTAVAEDMGRRYGAGAWSDAPGKSDVIRQLRASRVLVARANDELVGTVRLAVARPWAIESSCFTTVASAFYVLGLAVSPLARGQGVGTELMEAAQGVARSAGVEALWLDAYDNEAGAGAFYVKCGFTRVGRTTLGKDPLIYYERLIPR